METETALQRAARLVGGQSTLARRLGVSSPTVNQWFHGDRQVPAERCPLIEKLTGGQVRCEDLRPDVQWGVLREAVSIQTEEVRSAE